MDMPPDDQALPRVLIVEDEAIVSKDIERSLKRMRYAIAGKASSGEEAIEFALEQRPDLVLMDIMLKGQMSGIAAADRIRAATGAPVVFLTAYADRSTLDQAKQTEPYGYVLKPFTDAALHSALTMALHRHGRNMEVKKERDQLYRLVNGGDNGSLFVKSKGRLVRLRMKDIYYVEALRDYLGINLRDKRYTVHGTMKDIEARLPKANFVRVHRSFIANLDKIHAIGSANVVLEDGVRELPIGITYQREVHDRVHSI